MTTPSEQLLSDYQARSNLRDSAGRSISVRRLTALDKFRLLKAAGPDLSQNEAWLNVAALAVSVSEIDGVPKAAPANERQIETLVRELGDAGLSAIAEWSRNDEVTNETPDGDAPGNG